jgi:hypothetical protein
MAIGEIRFRHNGNQPQPFLTDFILMPEYIQRTKITGKKEGVSIGVYGMTGYIVEMPVHFIFVMTQHGNLRIKVPKKVFKLLHTDDPIVVCYRKGRWTGALEGKIAR